MWKLSLKPLFRKLCAVTLIGLFSFAASIAIAAETQATVKFAVVGPGPSTGDWSIYGEEMREGAEMAIEDINAKGGINGQKIDLQFFDDKGNRETSESIAKKISSSGVRFVVGHYNSTSSIYASPIYSKSDVLMVSPASTNPKFTDDGYWNTIRTSGRDDVQGTFAGEYIAKKFPGEKVVILHDGSTYGRGLATKVKSALNAAGTQEEIFSSVKFSPKDLSALSKRLQASQVKIVYFGGLAKQLGELARKTNDSGMNLQFVTGDGAAFIRDLTSSGGDGIEGTLMTFSYEDRINPKAAQVVERLRARGVEPIAYALKSYAAVQVIAKGAEWAGTNDPRAVATAIRSERPIPTILGNLSFDKKGDRREPDVTMYEWRKDSSGNWGFYSLD